MRELAAFTRTRGNSYVVTFHDVFLTTNRVAIVMELGGCDMWRWLERHDTFDKFEMSLNLCKAVASLHACGIIHRDIKPHNLLVNSDESGQSVKIIDFGMSKIESVVGMRHEIRTFIQTLWYRAPEVLLARRYRTYTSKIDVWSVGCVILHIYLGEPFIAASSEKAQLQKILEYAGRTGHGGTGVGLGLPFTKDMPGSIRTALTGMLRFDPERRSTMDEVLHDLMDGSTFKQEE
jgi:serine/threonine protein kinase